MALSFGVTVLPDPPASRLVELMALGEQNEVNDAIERSGSPAEHVERIAIAQETQYGVDVLAGVLE